MNYIKKQMVTDKGIAEYHFVISVNYTRNIVLGNYFIIADILSWPTLEQLLTGKNPSNVSRHFLEYPALTEIVLDGELCDNLETLLIADETSPVYGGEIVVINKPEINLENAKYNKWESIKRKRTEVINSPLTTPYGTIQCGPEDRQNLTDAIMMAQVLQSYTQSTDISWTMLDNSVVVLDLAKLIEIGLLLGAKIQDAHETSRALRQQLESAQTIEEVNAIIWPT